jgi:hypothetical protein
LPSELPKESSAHFGIALSGIIKQLLCVKEQQGTFSNGIDISLLSNGVVSNLIPQSARKIFLTNNNFIMDDRLTLASQQMGPLRVAMSI